MPRLTWDEVGKRVYETGVSMGVFFPQNSNGTYGKGCAWDGLTAVNENPSGGESNKQYADNIDYLNLISKEEYGATLNAFTYPAEFEECDGTKDIIPGIKVKQQTRKPFGFCYRTEKGNDTLGDDYGYIIHLIYGAKAKPSAKEYNTINESPEAINFSWEIETTKTKINKAGFKPTACLEIDSTVVSAEILKTIEDMIYGIDTVTPVEKTDTFEGDGTETVFALSGAVTDGAPVVKIDGVTKTATTDYTYNSETNKVTFTSAPANEAEVTITYTTTVEGTDPKLPTPDEIIDLFVTE